MSQLSKDFAQACAQKDYPRAHEILKNGSLYMDQIYDTWHKALDEGDDRLVDLFLQCRLELETELWRKMLLRPISSFRRWMNYFDQYRESETQEEDVIALDEALLEIQASFDHTLCVLQSRNYKKCVQKFGMSSDLMHVLTRTLNPNVPLDCRLPEEEEERLRQEIWSWMTPECFHQGLLHMMDRMSVRRAYDADQWRKEAVLGWTKQIQSSSTAWLEALFDKMQKKERSSSLFRTISFDLSTRFPEYLTLQAVVEKELLLRCTHPKDPSAPPAKRKL